MHGSRAHHPGHKSGNASKIDNRSEAASLRGVAKNARLLADGLEAKRVDEELSREVTAFLPQRDGIDAANGMFCTELTADPALSRFRTGMGNQLTHEIRRDP